jgi:hypothetical protein
MIGDRHLTEVNFAAIHLDIAQFEIEVPVN